MRFANIRELKLETNKVLEMSRKKGPIVVTRRGRPIALIRTINEEDFSYSLKPLWDRLRIAAGNAGYGPGDVEKLIKEARASKNER
jgi:prevent-host-death family protein